MEFSSLYFLYLFLPLTLLVYFLVPGLRLKNIVLLAASLCVDWHVAPVETLRKAVDNPAQSGLTDAEHRRANVLGVYEALPENVRDKRLLLIDDIVTTGSTLTECVRVLREAGAADVVCLTLARTEEEH